MIRPRRHLVAAGIGAAAFTVVLLAAMVSAHADVASWYGPGFHGKQTASGERFDQHAMTAAHRTLPFGTRVQVCAERCAVVRINDRGPFIRGRTIDLSKAAAIATGVAKRGVARVRLQRIN